jgi:hypothetical protein
VDTCKNGGKCSIRFQLIHCDCNKAFTGLYCHLNVKDGIDEYVANIAKELKTPFKRQEVFTILDLIAISRTNTIENGMRQQIYNTICKNIAYCLAKEFNELLSSNSDIDPDITQISNLYSLLKIQSNGKNRLLVQDSSNGEITSYSDLLAKHSKLNGLIIKQVNPAERKIYGNTQLNTQVILSNKASRDEAVIIAKQHGLSIVSDEDCIVKLKDNYKITDDILIVKTEEKILDSDNKVQNRVSVSYYNLGTRSMLDKNLCKSVSNSLKIPVTLTSIEKDAYEKYIQQGVDIFSPKKNRNQCLTYSTPVDDDSSLTINSFLGNRTECIQSGCYYNALTADNYITCNCNEEQADPTETDFSVMSCFSEVGMNGVNIGLIIAILLALSYIGLTVVFVYLRKNNLNIDKVIIQDCLHIDRKTMANLNEYFGIRRSSMSSNVRGMKLKDEGDLNTTRNLKTENPATNREVENQQLKLKENMGDLDNIDAGGTFAGEKRDDEIMIHNNFVVKRRASIETTNSEAGGSTEQPSTQSSFHKNGLVITMRDYDHLTLEEMFTFDQRSYLNYVVENIVRRNMIISIIFKHSIIDPVYIRITKAIFCFSLIFGTNAVFISNNIEAVRRVI